MCRPPRAISDVHLSRYVSRRQNKAPQISRRTKGLPSKNKKGAKGWRGRRAKVGKREWMKAPGGRTNDIRVLLRCEILEGDEEASSPRPCAFTRGPRLSSSSRIVSISSDMPDFARRRARNFPSCSSGERRRSRV